MSHVETNWKATAYELPEENVVVWAMDSAGYVQKLVMEKGLWFFPDKSMYVYFVPGFWKDVS